MYICPLPSPTPSHSSRLSQSPRLSSLRHRANFRWLFILHIGRAYASNEVNEPRTYYTEWSKSESKKQILHINTYIWNLERWYWWTYLKGSNGDADIENRLEWTFLRLEFPEVNWWPWANSSTGQPSEGSSTRWGPARTRPRGRYPQNWDPLEFSLFRGTIHDDAQWPASTGTGGQTGVFGRL